MSHTFSEYVDTWVCPACGEPTDYCIGHGEIGDPIGARILADHDTDNHLTCHPMAECHSAGMDPEDPTPLGMAIMALGVLAAILLLWAGLLVIFAPVPR